MSSEMLGSNIPAFNRVVSSNGLLLSTCLSCQKIYASPTPSGLRLAEASHRCSKLDITDPAATAEMNLFERKLREQPEETLIESHCKRCGCILIGRAIFGDLAEQEQRHTLQCSPEAGS